MNLPWDRLAPPTQDLAAVQRDLNGPAPTSGRIPDSVVILGAGLAGCWLARLLAERGISVRLVEQRRKVAGGASGNPAGIVKPHVTRSPAPAMSFHVAAHSCLLEKLGSLARDAGKAGTDTPDLTPCGVLQLVNDGYPASPHYASLDNTQATGIAGISLTGNALHFPDSGWLNPSALCRTLVSHPNIVLNTDHTVSGVYRLAGERNSRCWRVCVVGHHDICASNLVLACGSMLNRFEQTGFLPIIAARGQISRFRVHAGSPVPRCVISGRHYVIPHGDTILVGATFDRNVEDEAIRSLDHERNLAGLRATLPSLQVHRRPLDGYAGVRATTPDRLPIVGPVPDRVQMDVVYADLKHGKPLTHYPALPCVQGLYVLGGLGSRGIVTAPLAAKLLVELLMDRRSATWEKWGSLVNPARFHIRDIRRGIIRRS
ncbi:MAG: FAD-dependent 5-carboxymethylaminomethyl-2-thiouridine(34) oxidoreductase MnmC [Granulosicoccus sp.]|nr:FAD-dependent 5-carboxymethylaminomethyl-2-thiouridine(34) oxidoreductase MnmC [Granulosicoccus sp.]